MHLTEDEIAEACRTIKHALGQTPHPTTLREAVITGAVLGGVEWNLNRLPDSEHVRRALALIAALERLLNEDTVDLADRRKVAP